MSRRIVILAMAMAIFPIQSEAGIYICNDLVTSYLSARMYDHNLSDDYSGKMKLQSITNYIKNLVTTKYPEIASAHGSDSVMPDLGDYCPAHPNDDLDFAVSIVASRPSRY